MLIALAAVLLIFSQQWLGGLISLVQVVVPFQDAVTRIAGPTSGAETGEVDALERDRIAWRHRAAALEVRVNELEREVEVLTATRLWTTEGTRLGASGKLIPARVLTDDLLAWRDSRLVSAGTLQGVTRGAPVVSNHFSIARGDDANARSGMAVLLGEVLVGYIEQVGTHTARVKMLTDAAVEMKVKLGRFQEDAFSVRPGYVWMTGRGDGRMEIRDIAQRDVDDGSVSVGDVVLSDPLSFSLPAAMTLGHITKILPDRDKPLFARVIVEPAVASGSYNRVYVFDPGDGSS